MKVTLLLTKRADCNDSSIINIDSLLKSALSDEIESGIVEFDDNKTIIYSIKKARLIFKYSFVKKQKLHVLNLETDSENAASIKAFEVLCSSISLCEYSRNLNVIKAFDEPSQILCTRIYRLLSSFERLLRKLVYEIVVKAYGSEWCKLTIEAFQHNDVFKEINNEISKLSRQDNANKIEVALEEMDYDSLIKYLFSPKSPKDYSDVLEGDLADDKISSMSKDEIVSVIRASRPVSLWKLLFQSLYGFNDLNDDLDAIRRVRNKVMHSKRLAYEEYKSASKLLNKWIPIINKAILDNEKEEYVPAQSVNIIQSLSVFNNLFKALSPSIDALVSNAVESAALISKGLSEVIASAVPKIDLSSLGKNILLLSELGKNNSDYNELEDKENSSKDEDISH